MLFLNDIENFLGPLSEGAGLRSRPGECPFNRGDTPTTLAKSRLRRLLAARACGRSTTTWSPSPCGGGKGGADQPLLGISTYSRIR